MNKLEQAAQQALANGALTRATWASTCKTRPANCCAASINQLKAKNETLV